MKLTNTIFLGSVCLVGLVHGQGSIENARTDLALALERLEHTQRKIIEEETPLLNEVQELDLEVSSAGKELKILQRKEINIAGDQRALKNELASRVGEFAYTFDTLKGYSKGLANRLHGAEIQSYRDQLQKIESAATVDEISQSEQVFERLKFLEVGFDRLAKIAGGHRFDAKAKTPGDDIVKGKAIVLGPQGYFADESGDTVGYTGLTVSDQGYPNVLLADGSAVEGIQALANNGKAVAPIDASGGRALKIKEARKGLSDYLDGGGMVGYAIVGLGVLSSVIALFKFFEISRFHIPSRKDVNFILDDLLGDRVQEADRKAKEINGLSGKLAAAGVSHFFEKRRILEDALLEKLGAIQPKLERGLPFLALAAAAAPMMGLLGTVLGIMKTFDMMAIFGTGNAQNFSAGIGEALITTAMGLVVAIPVIIVHGMLKSLAKGRFGKSEAVALAFLNGTTEITSKPQKSSFSDDDIEEMEIQPV